jgi:hypothetical protein
LEWIEGEGATQSERRKARNKKKKERCVEPSMVSVGTLNVERRHEMRRLD